MYHVAVHPLPQRLLEHLRQQEFLRAGERVGVAVSGGIDSVALLRLVARVARTSLELSCRSFISITNCAGQNRMPMSNSLLVSLASTIWNSSATAMMSRNMRRTKSISVETAARELRYGFFGICLALTEPQGLNARSSSSPLRGPEGTLFHKIVTGHTLDDQAETVLMRMIRGTGMRGLGGIHPRIRDRGR